MKCTAWTVPNKKSCDDDADYIVGGWSLCDDHYQGLIDVLAEGRSFFTPIDQLYRVDLALHEEEGADAKDV